MLPLKLFVSTVVRTTGTSNTLVAFASARLLLIIVWRSKFETPNSICGCKSISATTQLSGVSRPFSLSFRRPFLDGIVPPIVVVDDPARPQSEAWCSHTLAQLPCYPGSKFRLGSGSPRLHAACRSMLSEIVFLSLVRSYRRAVVLLICGQYFFHFIYLYAW